MFLFLLALDLCLFMLLDLLPAAPIKQLGVMAIDPASLAAARERLGVSGPWYERLLLFWYHLIWGDFGRSLQGGYPIRAVVVDRLQVTFPLLILAALFIIALPVPLASLWARPGRAVSLRGRLLLLPLHLGLIPQFLLTIILFAIWTRFFANPAQDAGLGTPVRWGIAFIAIVAMPMVIAFLAAVEGFETACTARFTWTYLMLGMSNWHIRRLLMRNVSLALRPLTARLTLTCIIGAIFAELLFDLPGVGKLFVDALRTSDINMMRVLVLGIGLIVLIASEFERRTE